LSRDLFFWFYNQFGGTLGTGVYLTAGAGKAVAAGPVGEIALHRGAAVVTQNDLNQFVHSEDDYLSYLLPLSAFD
jgi:hypothetical protein